MDNSANRVKEAFRETPSDRGAKTEQFHDSKEIKDASEAGKAAYAEAVGLDETVETTGRVSEILKEGASEDQSSGGGKTAAAQTSRKQFDPAKIRAQLLNSLPNEKVMRSQVEREIKKEIDYLHKKAMKMLRKPGDISYFEMSNIMRKIRELKGILLRLSKIAMESLKTLWLRYVHGLM